MKRLALLTLARQYLNSQSVRMASKVLFRGREICVVDRGIADRMISTIRVISCVATVIVTGLILTMVGTSIYGVLITVR